MMNRVLGILLIVIIIGLVIAGGVQLNQKRIERRTQDAVTRLRLKHDQQTELLTASRIPILWIQPDDQKYTITAGSDDSSRELISRSLTFLTTATPDQVQVAYQTFGTDQQWSYEYHAENQNIIVLAFDTKKFGSLTVTITSTAEGTRVFLRRLMTP